MAKKVYFVADSNAYIYNSVFYDNFEDAKQDAIEVAQDNPGFEYYVYKAQKIGTVSIPLKAQYFAES